jgi:hypothetical protein
MTNAADDTGKGADVIDAEPTHLIRSPQTPTTINDLAALKGEALEVIEARVQVIETLRRASIRATSPADWLLFKAPEEQGGQIVGYLQDAGADRVRDLWGIEIFGVSAPEKITGNDPAVFHYIIRGSGRCKLTRQVLEEVEGGRSSTDDFCRGKVGADLELSVRKAARANLDGGITRELAGMKSVPLAEIEAAWIGTPKKIADCRRGRGFGTHEERLGARSDKAPDLDPPICPHCGSAGVYRAAKGNRGAFYGCPKYTTHQDKPAWIVDAAKWAAEAAQRGAAAPAAASSPEGQGARQAGRQDAGGGAARPAGQGSTHARPAPSGPPSGRVDRELRDDEIFGGGRRREPGEEG